MTAKSAFPSDFSHSTMARNPAGAGWPSKRPEFTIRSVADLETYASDRPFSGAGAPAARMTSTIGSPNFVAKAKSRSS